MNNDETMAEKMKGASPAGKRALHVGVLVGWYFLNSILNIASVGLGFGLFVLTIYHLAAIVKTFDSPEAREKFSEVTKDWDW